MMYSWKVLNIIFSYLIVDTYKQAKKKQAAMSEKKEQ